MRSWGKQVGFVALMALLAVFCVGLCELVACRFQDPALYHTVTAPARRLCYETGEAVEELTLERSQAYRPRSWQRMGYTLQHYRPEWPAPPEPEPAEEERPAPPPLTVIPEEEPITELLWNDGLEILTGGNLPLVYYNQKDEAWSECLFGRDPVGRFGCGPTVMSILVSSLSGETVNPEEMARWAGKAGFAAPGSGSYLSIVEGTARHYQLECSSVSLSAYIKCVEELKAGNLLIALMGKGHFTGGGHFILLRGCTEDGMVLIADPNSRDNSLQPWDPQIIVDELSRSRGNGAPLWRFPLSVSFQGMRP